ncbi:MAG: PAS domain-containing protein [Deltaproteobacteria bacterium]|nr:PAS domain-containing protein [Deltaproteobacteria bacterium]
MLKKNAKPTRLARAKKKDIFTVVGIGASAGGLEALEMFFSNVTPDTGCAFVVIQHLVQGHKSVMAGLLSKYTRMKVVEITDGVKVEPNVVYLNASGMDAGLLKGVLYLTEPGSSRPVRFPIDNFFISLAQTLGGRAVCVVMSGTGSDGAIGLKAVKEAGGVSFVQEEKQAKYPGMPGSAIGTGLADYIMPVEEMPAVIAGFAGQPYFRDKGKAVPAGKEFNAALQKILLVVRTTTGQDFSNYKLTTIRRRIERRMVLHRIKHIAVYLRLLKENVCEVDALYKDFLIGVTGFFRDAAAFNILKEKVVADIVRDKPSDSVARVWVPGCATGEEAYSIAMLFVEVMDAVGKRLTVQIFATDIDKDAINHARAAVFPEGIAADVSPERLKLFFTREGGFYRLKKELREMVVFAEQNVAKDPPFSRLDMVSCRNMLIYMDMSMQKKIIPLFYYTLNEGGCLFLGSSESIGTFSNLFSPVSTKWKIFRRKGSPTGRKAFVPELSTGVRPLMPAGIEAAKTARPGARELVERLILDEYGPPGVLVDDKFDALYFYGKTDRYLVQASGEASLNVIRMAREEIRHNLSLALHKAVQQKKTVVEDDLPVTEGAGVRHINLVVRPVGVNLSCNGLFMVVFEEKPGPDKSPLKKKKARTGGKADPRLAVLEQELKSTREYLQTIIEELGTANEELRAMNEELQSANEELQSTNEEMDTSKEELHSTNEELVMVNAELHDKVEEISRMNNDLQNLLSNIEIGAIFLDRALCIKRFTPLAKRVFNLIASDIGRPFGDITSRFEPDVCLCAVAGEVLATLAPGNIEVTTKDGVWFSVRILPYRTAEDVIDGLVITCSDITRLKQAELAINDARVYAEGIVDTVKEPLLVLDAGLRVRLANRAFYETFKLTSAETQARLIYDINGGQWNIPALRAMLEEIIPGGTVVEGVKVEHEFRGLGRRNIVLKARKITRVADRPDMILVAFDQVAPCP